MEQNIIEKDKEIEELWDQYELVLSYIDVNDDLVIAHDWHMWKKGTCIHVISDWFDKNYSKGYKKLQLVIENKRMQNISKYIVAVDDRFVRDTQIAPEELVRDYLRSADDVKDNDEYNWRDFGGKIIVGIFTSHSPENVIKRVSEEYSIHKAALYAYKLA